MPTLRSPKDQTGPDLGIASLTFEAYAFLERTPGEAPWLADIHCSASVPR
jgi:hypothetical protein